MVTEYCRQERHCECHNPACECRCHGDREAHQDWPSAQDPALPPSDASLPVRQGWCVPARVRFR